MSEIDDLSELIGKPGDSVPVVDAADIKVMWTECQKLKAEHPEYGKGAVAVGMSVWKEILAPGDAFKVAARLNLNWPQVGVPKSGFLFNLEGFLAEVQYEAFLHSSGKADK